VPNRFFDHCAGVGKKLTYIWRELFQSFTYEVKQIVQLSVTGLTTRPDLVKTVATIVLPSGWVAVMGALSTIMLSLNPNDSTNSNQSFDH
jgi:hypothetical protein